MVDDAVVLGVFAAVATVMLEVVVAAVPNDDIDKAIFGVMLLPVIGILKPQNVQTDSEDPTEETSITFVTSTRSQANPNMIPPITELAPKMATIKVPIVGDRPMVVVVYDGR